MSSRRSRGKPGSSGTYAPPAFKMPSMPTTMSTERSTLRPTSVSAPTPSCRRCARKLIGAPIELPHSSANFEPQRTAGASGRVPPALRTADARSPETKTMRQSDSIRGRICAPSLSVSIGTSSMRASRSAHEPLEQPQVVRQQTLDARFVEQVGVVLEAGSRGLPASRTGPAPARSARCPARSSAARISSPGSSTFEICVLWSTNITWNSGECSRSRRATSASTSRSNGMSWCA